MCHHCHYHKMTDFVRHLLLSVCHAYLVFKSYKCFSFLRKNKNGLPEAPLFDVFPATCILSVLYVVKY